MAFADQVQVEVAELRAEGVGVGGVLLAAGPADAQAVAPLARQFGVEEAFRPLLQRHFAAVLQHRQHRIGARLVAAQHPRLAEAMHTQHGERVAVAGGGEGALRRLVPDVDGITHRIDSWGAGKRSSMRNSPCMGTMIHAGRLAAS
ncbi:hypothetical protein NB706_002151 [Xanthomonas sacchari]|nr:hypothetical protein [Xanthomonas sacchari]